MYQLYQSYDYVALDFTTFAVTIPGTKLWMLLKGTYTESSVNGAVWGEDVSSPTYAGGNWGRYGNGGAAWEESTTIDGLFKQYVNPAGGLLMTAEI